MSDAGYTLHQNRLSDKSITSLTNHNSSNCG